MTLLEIIAKWAGLAGPELIVLLRKAGDTSPDLKPKADEWIAALQAAASPANLANVARAVISELGDIGQGKIHPKNHPSDAG